MGNIFSSVLWKKSANFNLDSKENSSLKRGSKRLSTKSEILVISRPLSDNSENTKQFERNERKTRSLHSAPNKTTKTRQTHSCLPENTDTNPVLITLQDIKLKTEKCEKEIEMIEQLDDNKYYHIEENLKRCIDNLDQMYDLVCKDQAMKMERKKVYKIVFKLLQKLDEKAGKNKTN